jgi:hypothetical protein
MKHLHTYLTAGALALTACSGGGDPKLRVGKEDNDGPGGSAGIGSGAGQVGDGGIGTGDEALSVRVEDIEKMTIEVITLACAGDCADIEAVAHGGNPPYAFAWEDGSKSAKRRVCLDESATLEVAATDTAITTEEFEYAAQTARSTISAVVLECTHVGDGGTSQGCLDNPSFEGLVTPDQFTAFDAKPWNACYAGGFITYAAIADAALWPTQAWNFPDPSDGNTYLALGQQGTLGGRAAQNLCTPLEAGRSLSFFVDLARATSDNASVEAVSQSMQILGGTEECAEALELWRSPELTTTWTTYCVTLTPTETVASLAFRPLAAGGGGEMEGLVDNIVVVDACP